MSDETPSNEQPPPDDDTGCTRCDAPLVFLGRKDLHEGGSFLLPDLFENRQRLDMWACSECGHVEFFMPLKAGR